MLPPLLLLHVVKYLLWLVSKEIIHEITKIKWKETLGPMPDLLPDLWGDGKELLCSMHTFDILDFIKTTNRAKIGLFIFS